MNLLGLTEKMSNFIIRPPRTHYEIRQLGSPVFNIGQTHFIRQDFRVNNYRKFQILGSYYKPYNYSLPRPTIVFLHGNSSSRVSVRAYLQQFLPKFNFVAFDFAGSGQSQGNYTTLGYEEKQDVQAILNFLASQFSINQIILWGRSMGAVTAILYAAKHHKKNNFIGSNLQYYSMKPPPTQIKIKALVLDSPFSDLQKLMKQKGVDMFPYLPNFLIDLQIDQIQRYIQNTIWESQKTDFNLKKLKPKDDMKKLDPSISLFFITAKNDKIIDYHHTIELYREANSQTRKQIEIVNGGHNDFRPIQTLKSIRSFLLQTAYLDFNRSEQNISSRQIQEKSCSSKESQQINLNNKAYFLKFKLKKQKDQAKVTQKNSNTKIISRVLQYQNKQRPRKKGISLLSNPLQALIRSPKQFADEATSIQSCIYPATNTPNFNKCELSSVRSNILDQNQIRHKRRYLNKINQETHCSQSKKKSRESDQPLNLRTLIKKKYESPNSHFKNYVKNLQISSNSCKNLNSSFQKGFKSQYPHSKNQDSQQKVKCSFREKKLAIINPRMNQPQNILYNGYKNGRANNNSNYSINNNDSFCSLEKQQNKKLTSSYKMISDFRKFNESKQVSSKLHQSYKQLCSTLQSSYKIESKGQNSMVHSQQIY